MPFGVCEACGFIAKGTNVSYYCFFQSLLGRGGGRDAGVGGGEKDSWTPQSGRELEGKSLSEGNVILRIVLSDVFKNLIWVWRRRS